LQKYRFSGYFCSGHLDQIDDFSVEMQVVSKMKQLGTDFIARMLYDYMKCEPLTLKAIPGFSVNSVSYEIVGPVFDNDFGVIYSFKILDCLNLEYDHSRWVKS
jgi:hypothetical protein